MYTALAEVYDLFYDGDMSARADYYCGFIPSGASGADLGCGTGVLTLEMYRRGYKVYGVDNSVSMLNKARERARNAGADIDFVVGDAAELPYIKQLDYVVAANDVFNYVGNADKAFKNVYAALRDEGVLAFDISSDYKLKNILDGNTFSETKRGVTYIWQNFRKRDKLIIDFTVFSPRGETYIKTCETQVQHIRSAEQITAALENAGFSTVKSYAFGKKSKPRENTERIAFIAKKLKKG